MVRDYDVEALHEIMHDNGIDVPLETTKKICEDFIDCYISNREAESDHCLCDGETDFQKLEKLNKKVNRLEYELKRSSHKNSVYENYLLKKTNALYVSVDDDNVVYKW